MTQPNWGILSGGNGPLQMFAYGQQIGADMRARREEKERKGALAGYLANPDDPEAYKTLTTAAPEVAFQIHGQRQAERRAQAEEAKTADRNRLYGLAAQGDQAALAQLWGADPEAALKLDDRQLEQFNKGAGYLAQQALYIDTLPEEQRAAAWDAAVMRGSQMGMPGLEQYVGQYSPEALQAVVSQAGGMQQFLDNRKPEYRVIPEGGTMVDISNPEAVQQYQQGGGQLAPGTIEGGYRYNGGDPGNPENWSKVEGGASAQASGPFDKSFNPLPDFQAAGFRPTSGYRTQAHQDSLVRQGLTDTRRSHHTEGNAIDFAIPKGWTKQQAMAWVKKQYPGARVATTNGNAIHVTFPGWGSAPDVSGSRRRYGGQ